MTIEPKKLDLNEPLSRKDEIVLAARELYEQRGLEHTTIKDIADRVGVTRSLFYHYFKGKDEVTEAVLDDYVNDFVQMTYYWNESRIEGDLRGALVSCIQMMRRGIFDKDHFRSDLITSENARLYLLFLQRATETLAKYMVETAVADYRERHDVHIDHVYETLYTMIIGLIGFMRRYPDASDELLEDLVAQTLRMDLNETYRQQKAATG